MAQSRQNITNTTNAFDSLLAQGHRCQKCSDFSGASLPKLTK